MTTSVSPAGAGTVSVEITDSSEGAQGSWIKEYIFTAKPASGYEFVEFYIRKEGDLRGPFVHESYDRNNPSSGYYEYYNIWYNLPSYVGCYQNLSVEAVFRKPGGTGLILRSGSTIARRGSTILRDLPAS